MNLGLPQTLDILVYYSISWRAWLCRKMILAFIHSLSAMAVGTDSHASSFFVCSFVVLGMSSQVSCFSSSKLLGLHVQKFCFCFSSSLHFSFEFSSVWDIQDSSDYPLQIIVHAHVQRILITGRNINSFSETRNNKLVIVSILIEMKPNSTSKLVLYNLPGVYFLKEC